MDGGCFHTGSTLRPQDKSGEGVYWSGRIPVRFRHQRTSALRTLHVGADWRLVHPWIEDIRQRGVAACSPCVFQCRRPALADHHGGAGFRRGTVHGRVAVSCAVGGFLRRHYRTG
ncbi:hypothetical protein [Flavimaribacter sediminis]|uniref:hypothetical protein n=1 Tax=Flavimaribacter sediminis TaxID=2865987 RepID=UPI00351E1F57